MPDPTAIAVALAVATLALLLVPVVAGELAAARERRVAGAQRDLALERFDAMSAVAQHRLELLVEAKAHLVAARRDFEGSAALRDALDAALAGAPPGDELGAVERLLLADADRRLGRARAAGGAGALEAPGDAGGAARVGPDGPGVAARA